MKTRTFFPGLVVLMLMLCGNLYAQNAQDVADKFLDYYNEKEYSYTLEDETQWYNYFKSQMGNKESAVLKGVKSYSDKLCGGNMVEMKEGCYIDFALNRYYAIKGYTECADPSKDKIEKAWLSLEKKLRNFCTAYIEYQYRDGYGSMMGLDDVSCSDGIQECHRSLWNGKNNNVKSSANPIKSLSVMMQRLSSVQKSINDIDLYKATIILMNELKNYVTGFGSKVPYTHLDRLNKFLEDATTTDY